MGKGCGEIDEGNVIEFRSADPPRLEDAEKTSFVEITLGVGWQAANTFGSGRALSKDRNERPRAPKHCFIIFQCRDARTILGLEFQNAFAHGVHQDWTNWTCPSLFCLSVDKIAGCGRPGKFALR